MNIQLIALDIDGTLTNDQKQITPATQDALLSVQENGTTAGTCFRATAPWTSGIC